MAKWTKAQHEKFQKTLAAKKFVGDFRKIKAEVVGEPVGLGSY